MAFMPWTLPMQIGELTGQYGWSSKGAGLIMTLELLLAGAVIALLTPVVPKLQPKIFGIFGAPLAAIGFQRLPQSLWIGRNHTRSL
jgi:hypothetical protein